jgi:hypothetical protein
MKMHREDAKVRASARKNSSKQLTNYTNRTGDSQRHLQRQKGESLTNHCQWLNVIILQVLVVQVRRLVSSSLVRKKESSDCNFG